MGAGKNILIINGSIRGTQGNSGAVTRIAEKFLTGTHSATVSILNLTEPKPAIKEVYDILNAADGFLIITGTYWNNWGSSLQRFIEVMTTFENAPCFFGKPLVCVVSMDSVGGLEVAARIHSVFAGLGCWSPPCSTLVLSRIGQEAVLATEGQENDLNEDVWRIADIEVVLTNLIIAAGMKCDIWACWPKITLKLAGDEWPETGPLDLGTPRFL